jgi:hypothetical protein
LKRDPFKKMKRRGVQKFSVCDYVCFFVFIHGIIFVCAALMVYAHPPIYMDCSFTMGPQGPPGAQGAPGFKGEQGSLIVV